MLTISSRSNHTSIGKEYYLILLISVNVKSLGHHITYVKNDTGGEG